MDALEYAKKRWEFVWCTIDGIDGIFKVYPGGRAERYPENERYSARLRSWLESLPIDTISTLKT